MLYSVIMARENRHIIAFRFVKAVGLIVLLTGGVWAYREFNFLSMRKSLSAAIPRAMVSTYPEYLYSGQMPDVKQLKEFRRGDFIQAYSKYDAYVANGETSGTFVITYIRKAGLSQKDEFIFPRYWAAQVHDNGARHREATEEAEEG